MKQERAVDLLDDAIHDIELLLGGSGSGKSFIATFKVVRDTLRYCAPSLICRDKYVDLQQGMIDQIIPAILQAIAEVNGHNGSWTTWKIDGLKFAQWGEKKTKLTFCNGAYIRFGGLSKRDLSESGSDKILSPSWLHILVEEVSECEWDIIELLITRLRFQVKGVLNKLMMTENPPSINHWSYRRFFERKREDGSTMSDDEIARYAHLEMQPKDNVENLGEAYIRNLSQLSGANRERFYEGRFQDTESGDILKRIQWTDSLPRSFDWDKLIIYTDPTPLTGKEHSIYADYKASVLCGLFEGVTYVLDIRMIRGSTLDLLNNIRQLWDASPNQSITELWMEKKGVPSDFNQVLVQFASLTGWSVPIQWDTRVFGDKKAAIETFLQPLFENDMIFFNQAFRDTERGRQAQFQILKFSRKGNKNVHDDIPDAIMRADTKMKGKQKRKHIRNARLVAFVKPAYIHDKANG
ncbi:phage terminase large subunit [Alistipes putredinis]|uniref:phage terminase large subunit n=1 Tax=Alistipes putredinis TaxID=28117 RepID=UPI003AADD4D4